jgi:hypothetical protein
MSAATDAERAKAYRDRKRGAAPRQLQPHGTVAAARRHQRADEQLCAACTTAWAEHQARQYQQRRTARPSPVTRLAVVVPQRFYDDHEARGLVVGEVELVKVLARSYRLRMTTAQLAELRSDAAYYADQVDAFDADLRGLCSSAAATVRAIDKATQLLADQVAGRKGGQR